jgi:ABC-type molybdate transport system substrate-binding protein
MTVYLFADSSYREGAADAALAFSKANPWARVVPRFAPSGELVDRIRRGEEADLVLLDGALARKLAEEGLLTRGSMATVGRSPLVFAGREGTRARRIGDLPALSRIVAADPARHPSGVYALEAMRKGAVRGGEYGEAEGEDGKGGKGGGTENLSCTAADGREALAALARGEAEGAFAFRTDVDAVPSARVLFVVPRTLYGSPDVVVALTPMAGSNDGALCLFRFFRSADGKRSLARHGVETGE